MPRAIEQLPGGTASADYRNALAAEVLEALNVGETVILHPSNAVRDGVRVKAR